MLEISDSPYGKLRYKYVKVLVFFYTIPDKTEAVVGLIRPWNPIHVYL